MRRMSFMLLAMVAGCGQAVAQGAEAAESGSRRPATLRQQVEERFAVRVSEELGLDDEQERRLRETSMEYAGRRRALSATERALGRALDEQLRLHAGARADEDSVGRLTERLVEVRAELAGTYEDEVKELGRFLSPLQRAQFYVLRERLVSEAERVRAERTRRD